MLRDALVLSLGYNATLVTLGAAILGCSAGIAGSFLYLRKNALISDAISHATLPGLGLAFMLASSLGFDGRSLIVLLVGAGFSAALGLMAVSWLTHMTRLEKDAAIGAVLSVFFGFGVVVLTIVQNNPSGSQAGLEGFLLGSTAGMLLNESFLILLTSLVAFALLVIFYRPITLVSFDEGYARSIGISVRLVDYLILAVALVVTVIGMKIVGLILIVALLIIPSVSARFWSDKAHRIVILSGIFGALSGYVGSAVSAVSLGLPTGPIIVLCSTAVFVVSFLFAPRRGILSSMIKSLRFEQTLHLAQGLLAIAQEQPIYEAKTLRILKRKGYLRRDSVPTQLGYARAQKTLLNERRWAYWINHHNGTQGLHTHQISTLIDIEQKLTPDQISLIDQGLANAQEGRLA